MIIHIEKMEVSIPVDSIILPGILNIPDNPNGLVIFSHGSGSSRLSPRNNKVAEHLQKNGYATLLFDLLTATEDKQHDMRFDISLLTSRLIKVTEWVSEFRVLQNLSIGYFGASTGAASALAAATQLKDVIKAVVSRGGRPDMADQYVPLVSASTLLIIGSRDQVVIELNEKAYDQLQCEKELTIVQNADHLFTQKGKLEEVATLAIQWFDLHLKKIKSQTNDI